eukprot:scaffold6690_cov68-Phaeocystis_antarctica.AAC.4
MAIFVDLGEKKCSVEVKLDGSGVPVVKYLSTALSSHLADLEIVIINPGFPGPSPGNGGQLETSLSRFTRNLAR